MCSVFDYKDERERISTELDKIISEIPTEGNIKENVQRYSNKRSKVSPGLFLVSTFKSFSKNRDEIYEYAANLEFLNILPVIQDKLNDQFIWDDFDHNQAGLEMMVYLFAGVSTINGLARWDVDEVEDEDGRKPEMDPFNMFCSISQKGINRDMGCTNLFHDGNNGNGKGFLNGFLGGKDGPNNKITTYEEYLKNESINLDEILKEGLNLSQFYANGSRMGEKEFREKQKTIEEAGRNLSICYQILEDIEKIKSIIEGNREDYNFYDLFPLILIDNKIDVARKAYNHGDKDILKKIIKSIDTNKAISKMKRYSKTYWERGISLLDKAHQPLIECAKISKEQLSGN